jgi:hypothetical protein
MTGRILRARVEPLVVVAAAALLGACSSPGAVAGRATDMDGRGLANVRVVVDGLKTHIEQQTDASGAFRVADLAAGPYAVTFDRPGYAAERREAVAVRTDGTTTLTVPLHPACLEEGSYTDGGIAWALRAAEAVVYLRIDRVESPDRWISNDLCVVGTDHTATVVNLLNMDTSAGTVTEKIHLVRDGREGFPAGTEYIAFIRWEAAIGRYRPVAGPIFMIPVKDGRVVWMRSDVPGVRDGDPVSKAMGALFALLPAARRGH